MSKHVITIGKKRSKMVADIVRLIQHSAYRRLINLENDLENVLTPLSGGVAEYWKTRTKELEHEVEELKALETILTGATSITVTHEVKGN